MNFLTAKVVEEGGQIFITGDSFKLKPAPAHVALLKAYVGKEVSFGIRPEDLTVADKGASEVIKAKVTVVEPLGAEINIYASVSGQSVTSRVPPHHSYRIGDEIAFDPLMVPKLAICQSIGKEFVTTVTQNMPKANMVALPAR